MNDKFNLTIKDYEGSFKPTWCPGCGNFSQWRAIRQALIELELKNGVEHWVGLNNFYVITRYNHSQLYAMAVYQLSQAIVEKRNVTVADAKARANNNADANVDTAAKRENN